MRSLARSIAVVATTALVFAASAAGQSYTGTWDLSPDIKYQPGGSCPVFQFDQIQLNDSNPNVTVVTNSPDPNAPGVLVGSFVNATTIRVQSSGVGVCGQFIDYTMQLDVGAQPTLTGTFRVDGTNLPCQCPDQNYVFSGKLVSGAWSYCTAGKSASGCAAYLGATGLASASQVSGFVVSAGNAEGAKNGMLFFGANGRQANPWGNGTSFQCVAPPVKRGGLLVGTGTPGFCDGTFSQDLNARWCPTCPRPLHNPGAGAIVQLQLWYRDPLNTSNQTTSLSHALEFTVWP